MLCNNEDTSKAHEMREIIMNNFSEKGMNIQKLSKLAGCSRSHMIRSFRKNFNTTPLRFLSECRIEKAKQLIENNVKISLKEIADQCGFRSIFHFSKRFKEIVGHNPSEHYFKSGVYKGSAKTQQEIFKFRYKQLYNEKINIDAKDFKFDINQVNDALKMILEYDGGDIVKMQAKISRVQKYVERSIRSEKNRLHNK